MIMNGTCEAARCFLREFDNVEEIASSQSSTVAANLDEAIMLVSKHKTVTIHYTLRDDQGTIIEESRGREPVTYVHGSGAMLSGLEQVLDGKRAGESLSVTLSPSQAFGYRREELIQTLPRNRFDTEKDLEVGMRFKGPLLGESIPMTITKVLGDAITVDGNHPFAGLTLRADIDVIDVRQATPEEMAQARPN